MFEAVIVYLIIFGYLFICITHLFICLSCAQVNLMSKALQNISHHHL